ncbi:MAG: hypothetical protein OEV49_09035 [candidate division Zixibacteria bacterium]|nr:hypothetical protein [candidate division Zixibacteria bacterium]MDH3938800.1 hypothetical protein [candidate division Zixibacteria bacterium]MDH4035133.1 hypothetical protein [candidate division Zixibacteria bacterium]
MAGPETQIEQPIAFDHVRHVTYLSEGEHRREKIDMHKEILGEDEASEEVLQGQCLECHDDLTDEAPDCAGCHILFQDAALRARKDVRACVACHRSTWTGYSAGIPSVTVCRSCHADEPRTDSEQEAHLREYIDRSEDIPWVRITEMDPHVHTSHKAHIRYAGYACTQCHNGLDQQVDTPLDLHVTTMEACIECHEENNVSDGCLTCHK